MVKKSRPALISEAEHDAEHKYQRSKNCFLMKPEAKGGLCQLALFAMNTISRGGSNVKVGDKVFHPDDGFGVVSRNGNPNYVFVRFKNSDKEIRVETFYVSQKIV